MNDLKQNDIQLLCVETRAFDVFVEYKFRGRIHEAIYPFPMLDAEIEGWLRQASFLTVEVPHEKGQ